MINFFIIRPFSRDAFSHGPIDVSMDCNQMNDKIVCSFDFKNFGQQNLYLLKRNTPFERLHSPIFIVTKNSRLISYDGIISLRSPPTADDYHFLGAQDTSSVSIEISSVFCFDEDGIYTVHYNEPIMYVTQKEMMLLHQESTASFSPLHSFELSESVNVHVRNAAGKVMKTVGQLIEETLMTDSTDDNTVHISAPCSTSIKGGTSEKIRKLQEAHNLQCASTGYSNAINKLHTDAALATEWFGNGPKKTAQTKFNQMKSCVDVTVSYDFTDPYNGCDGYTLAYERRNTGKIIFVCDKFFDYPQRCQKDLSLTQEGSLVHEWSHPCADTEDYFYGALYARLVAKSSSEQAQHNADNYHYFYCDAQFK